MRIETWKRLNDLPNINSDERSWHLTTGSILLRTIYIFALQDEINYKLANRENKRYFMKYFYATFPVFLCNIYLWRQSPGSETMKAIKICFNKLCK
jgi:hypothetical protein